MSFRSFARFTRSALVSIVAIGALASCQHDLLGTINHSWQLSTVNHSALPYTVPHSSPEIVITAGHAEIDGDGNYQFTFTGTSDGDDGSVGSDDGTWSIHSSTFLFNSSHVGIDSYIAALGSGTFDLTLPGQVVHSTDQSIDMVFEEIQ
jgi:hypothetical protein